MCNYKISIFQCKYSQHYQNIQDFIKYYKWYIYILQIIKIQPDAKFYFKKTNLPIETVFEVFCEQQKQEENEQNLLQINWALTYLFKKDDVQQDKQNTGFIADMGSMTLDQTFKQFIKQNRPAIQRKFLNECMAQYTDYLKDTNQIFESFYSLSFDVFQADKKLDNEIIDKSTFFIFQQMSFFENLIIFPQDLLNFTNDITKAYKDVPYHNRMHAVDVMQFEVYMLYSCDFVNITKITQYEQVNMIIAALIHDIYHPGTNNVFSMKTCDEWALTYNDIAIIENYSLTEGLVMIEKHKLFKNYSDEQKLKARQQIIKLVLATDMSRHFLHMSALKNRAISDKFDPQGDDKILLMETVMHAADISNGLKSFDMSFNWAQRVVTEFWNQGDLERNLGLPITNLCDKYTVNFAKSQIGFLEYIVQPMFMLIGTFVPVIQQNYNKTEKNLSQWKELIPKYDEELKQRNINKSFEIKI